MKPAAQVAADGFAALDQLATMVAVVAHDGACRRANAALEDQTGMARRALERGRVQDWLTHPQQMADTLAAVAANEVTSGRFESLLQRAPTLGAGHGELPVHVIVSRTDWPGLLLVEMIEIDEGEHAASCLCGAIGPSRPTPEAATAAWNGDKLVGMQAMGPVSGSAYHQARTLVRTGRVL